jgi:hypothetical protein
MRVGYEIAKEFYDAAVSGADALASRAGFAAMLKRIEGNGEFDKAMTVAKLRGAGERKRATGVNVEGRKSQTELRPEVVAEAKRFRRKTT